MDIIYCLLNIEDTHRTMVTSAFDGRFLRLVDPIHGQYAATCKVTTPMNGNVCS